MDVAQIPFTRPGIVLALEIAADLDAGADKTALLRTSLYLDVAALLETPPSRRANAQLVARTFPLIVTGCCVASTVRLAFCST